MSTRGNGHDSSTRPPDVKPGRLAAWVTLVLGLSACQRSGVTDQRIVPLDPHALARTDAGRAALPNAPLPTATYLLRPTSPTPLEPLARALERRARGLDATEARAAVHDDSIELHVTLPMRGGLATLFPDQVKRRGLLTIAAFDPHCDPFSTAELPSGIGHGYDTADWLTQPFTFAYARPSRATGAAPLAPLQRLVAATTPPAGHTILIGAVRDYAGESGRRTYCVETRDALFAPRVIETETTLDPHTLYPLLRLHLGPPDDARIERLRARGGGLLLAMDDEVIGITDGTSVRGRDWIDVVPSAPNSSVSPEMVSALLAGGVLPVPVDVTVR